MKLPHSPVPDSERSTRNSTILMRFRVVGLATSSEGIGRAASGGREPPGEHWHSTGPQRPSLSEHSPLVPQRRLPQSCLHSKGPESGKALEPERHSKLNPPTKLLPPPGPSQGPPCPAAILLYASMLTSESLEKKEMHFASLTSPSNQQSSSAACPSSPRGTTTSSSVKERHPAYHLQWRFMQRKQGRESDPAEGRETVNSSSPVG